MDRRDISNQVLSRKRLPKLSHSLLLVCAFLAHTDYMYWARSLRVNKIQSAPSRTRPWLAPDACQSLPLTCRHNDPCANLYAQWTAVAIHTLALDIKSHHVNYIVMHDLKTLKTVDDVVAAFGGPSAAAEWAGIGKTAVSNWLARGYIPPGWHFRMSQHFSGRGIVLAGSVFGQSDEPVHRRFHHAAA